MRKIIFILIFIIAAFIILNLSYKIDESGEKTVVIAAGAVGSEFELTKRNCEEWTKTSGYKVRMFQSPNLTNDRLALFQQIFSAKSDEIDVVQIDVVWPMLLKKHFVDLRKFIPKKEVRKHFESIIRNASDGKGRLLAMPFYSDVGLIYYRKDLLEKHGVKPPSTWNEMKEAAIKVLEAEKKGNPSLTGFVFQGKAYEGLTCNALEWIRSFGGGKIIDEISGRVNLNNPEAVKALETAASFIGTISPQGVLNYAEEDARGVFQSGNAIFMRNWPYAWALMNHEDSPVKGKVGIMTIPSGKEGLKGSGTLGGWNLAVSKYSKNKKAAADLVRYLTSSEIQLKRAIMGGYNPTINELYENRELLEKLPFFKDLNEAYKNAVTRPSAKSGRYYNRISNIFWNAVHSVLSKDSKAEDALESAQKDIERVLRKVE